MMRSLLLIGLCTACGTDVFSSGDAAPSDSGGDTDGAACSASFCSMQPLAGLAFCGDFDEGSATLGWSVLSTGGSTGTLDMSTYTSCPTSLLVDMPMQNSLAAYMQGVNFGPTGGVTIDWDVKLPVLPPPNDSGVVSTDDFIVTELRKSSDTGWHVRIEHSADGLWFVRVATAGGNIAGNAGINPLLDKWNHMTLKVQFASSTGSGTVELDYVKADNTSGVALPQAPPDVAAPLTFGIGATATTATSRDWKFSFDSVVVRAN